MPNIKYTLEDLRVNPGLKLPPFNLVIERGLVDRFCRATGDDGANWQNEAPPVLALTLGFGQMLEVISADDITVLHGSSELESLKPLEVGQEVTVETSLLSLRERPGKMGLSSFLNFEMQVTNKQGELLARVCQLAIVYSA
ncbi:hypothetical protein CY91_05720 [Dehalococcoides mccartyi]|jgi:hypothetical protein|uniref:FAS1-like dehydratase domain-containing protein n=2 Tax=Dehalococcoides mccartyi TaxID=61435 RepID=A0A142V938_9CHLR|nr:MULTISPECIES: MaoC family dehydratase N-terminal domain-containing protein [Dehalococcoides]AGG06158.1 hypothetical protein dcmb_530 [Dehalococcoides mccartyi DCMB5]AGG07590.1 hypothetical protein btf_484 [Dehalococcoides mccartyi BTF08]AII60622.1 hypothetical protein X794_02020 [Dehalococcoides mccartyi CG5]AMU86288.1 hypothetical protein Dm11a5_0462 [Dehalococcoides mccartyi]AOV99124.1 hypothetical protein DCWBC2_0460 [Dehalococcoides mccartyi]